MHWVFRQTFLLFGLGMLSQLFLPPNLYAQNRNTPRITQFYQKISSDGTAAPEYWVEYKPCLGADHCYVQVTTPNEKTVERIKKKDRENAPSVHYYQWKVGDGTALDEIGDVDAGVMNALPDAETE